MKSALPLTVSVIIPIHNGGEDFSKCLASIAHAEPAPDEIIVVADGESDGSYRAAEQYQVQLIKKEINGGPAVARNLGVKHSHGAILLFLDADVVASPDIIARVVEQFQKYPSVAALIGSYDENPGANNFLSQYKNLFHHYVHQQGNENAFTFWGACGAIRREVFTSIDGYDENYPLPSIEDIELGYR
jgi:GT2 family glycosyltransferase